ncbi:MAG: HD domain-containing protein [Spirochaetales bacterium]|nr:HD domain-containing protein [Spirochaetales bacterium]
MNERGKIRDYLAYEFTEPIRDPLWNHIYLTPGLKEIAATQAFQKLAGIKQLGPTYMVYPGATHTRLNHSLGVFSLSRRVIQALVSFDSVCTLTAEGVRSFLCAAMLHDLGHFPYAHSLKELPLASHERLTAWIVRDAPLAGVIKEAMHADPEVVAAIVDTGVDAGGSAEIAIYRKILSGVLDPDKLDYLSRDAYFCGVPYGVQDIDFIISKLRYHEPEGLVLDEQGLHAVENVLFSKYLMYRSVYWHKAVRIATAMIKKSIFLGMRDGIIGPSALYGLDDNDFFSKFGSDTYKYSGLVKAVNTRQLYKTVAEAPFVAGNPSHERLLDLDARSELEGEICGEINTDATGVIIDIPEKISFEVELQIERAGDLVPFVKAGTVFSKDVIGGFAGTLRKIRLMVHPDLAVESRSYGDIFRWIN